MPFYPDNLKKYRERHSKDRAKISAHIANKKQELAEMDKRRKNDLKALEEYIASCMAEHDRLEECVFDSDRAEVILYDFILLSEQIEDLLDRRRALAESAKVVDSSLLSVLKQQYSTACHRLGR